MKYLLLMLLTTALVLPARADGYAIQLGAFKEFERAESVQEVLEDADYPTYLAQENELLKLRVGPYDSKKSAADEADALWAFLVARFGPEEFQKPWVLLDKEERANARTASAVRLEETKTLSLTSKSVSFPELSSEAEASSGELIELAKSLLGSPYRWAGNGPDKFDCSGFIAYVFSQHGYDLPRMARTQFEVGQDVEIDELQPGDLVFFQTYRPGASHVGIYLGDDEFIHASSGSGGVVITPLTKRYYANRYLGAKRITKTQLASR